MDNLSLIKWLVIGTSDNHQKVEIMLKPEGSFGLCSMQMPWVEEIWQDAEDEVWLTIRGQEEPVNILIYSDCIDQIYKYLEEHKYDGLSDEELKEIFDDMQDSSTVDAYKVV